MSRGDSGGVSFRNHLSDDEQPYIITHKAKKTPKSTTSSSSSPKPATTASFFQSIARQCEQLIDTDTWCSAGPTSTASNRMASATALQKKEYTDYLSDAIGNDTSLDTDTADNHNLVSLDLSGVAHDDENEKDDEDLQFPTHLLDDEQEAAETKETPSSSNHSHHPEEEEEEEDDDIVSAASSSASPAPPDPSAFESIAPEETFLSPPARSSAQKNADDQTQTDQSSFFVNGLLSPFSPLLRQPQASKHNTTTSSSGIPQDYGPYISLAPCRKVSVVVKVLDSTHSSTKVDVEGEAEEEQACVFPHIVQNQHSNQNPSSPAPTAPTSTNSSTTTKSISKPRNLVVVKPSAFGRRIPSRVTMETARLVAQVAHIPSEDWARLYQFHHVLFESNTESSTQQNNHASLLALAQAAAQDAIVEQQSSLLLSVGHAPSCIRTTSSTSSMLTTTLQALQGILEEEHVCTVTILELLDTGAMVDVLNNNSENNNNIQFRHNDTDGGVLVTGLEHVPLDSLPALLAQPQLLRRRSKSSNSSLIATIYVWDNGVDHSLQKLASATTITCVELCHNNNKNKGKQPQATTATSSSSLQRNSVVSLGRALRQLVLQDAMLQHQQHQQEDNDPNKSMISTASSASDGTGTVKLFSYRECPLTKVLQRPLEQSKIVILASISALSQDYDQTVSTLNYVKQFLLPLSSSKSTSRSATKTTTKPTTLTSPFQDEARTNQKAASSSPSAAAKTTNHHNMLPEIKLQEYSHNEQWLEQLVGDPRQRLAKVMIHKSNTSGTPSTNKRRMVYTPSKDETPLGVYDDDGEDDVRQEEDYDYTKKNDDDLQPIERLAEVASPQRQPASNTPTTSTHKANLNLDHPTGSVVKYEYPDAPKPLNFDDNDNDEYAPSTTEYDMPDETDYVNQDDDDDDDDVQEQESTMMDVTQNYNDISHHWQDGYAKAYPEEELVFHREESFLEEQDDGTPTVVWNRSTRSRHHTQQPTPTTDYYFDQASGMPLVVEHNDDEAPPTITEPSPLKQFLSTTSQYSPQYSHAQLIMEEDDGRNDNPARRLDMDRLQHSNSNEQQQEQQDEEEAASLPPQDDHAIQDMSGEVSKTLAQTSWLDEMGDEDVRGSADLNLDAQYDSLPEQPVVTTTSTTTSTIPPETPYTKSPLQVDLSRIDEPTPMASAFSPPHYSAAPAHPSPLRKFTPQKTSSSSIHQATSDSSPAIQKASPAVHRTLNDDSMAATATTTPGRSKYGLVEDASDDGADTGNQSRMSTNNDTPSKDHRFISELSTILYGEDQTASHFDDLEVLDEAIQKLSATNLYQKGSQSLQHLRETLLSQQKSLSKLQEERDQARTRLEETEDELLKYADEHDDDIQRYEGEIADLKDRLEGTLEDKIRVEKLAGEANAIQESLKQNLKHLQEDLEATKKQSESRQREIQEVTEAREQLRQDLATATDRLNQLDGSYQEGVREKSELEYLVEDLREERSKLETERAADKDTISRLEGELKDQAGKLHDLALELDQLQNTRQEELSQLEGLQNETRRFGSSLENLENERSNLQKLREEDQRIIDDLREQLKNAKAHNERYLDDRRQHEELQRSDALTIESLRNELRELRSTLHEMEQAKLKFSGEQNESASRIQMLESEIQRLRDACDQSEEQKARLEAAKRGDEETIERLQSQLRNGEASLADLERMHQEVSRLKQENVDLESLNARRKADYHNDVKEKEDLLFRNKNEIESLKHELDTFRDREREQTKQADDEIRRLSRVVSDYKEDLSRAVGDKDDLLAKLAALEAKHTELTYDLSERDAKIQSYATRMQQYKEDADELKNRERDLLSSANNTSRNLEARISELSAELAVAKQLREDAERKLDTETRAIRSRSSDLEQAKFDLERQTHHVDRLTRELDRVRDENTHANERIRRMEAELKRFQTETKDRVNRVVNDQRDAVSLLEDTRSKNRELSQEKRDLEHLVHRLRRERDACFKALERGKGRIAMVGARSHAASIVNGETPSTLSAIPETSSRGIHADSPNQAHDQAATYTPELYLTDVMSTVDQATMASRAEEIAACLALSAKQSLHESQDEASHLRSRVYRLEEEKEAETAELKARIRSLERELLYEQAPPGSRYDDHHSGYGKSPGASRRYRY